MSFRVERRFNLLILEEGEEYVADVSATMSLEKRGTKAESKGRLRIGSKSLVFQPDEVSEAILKFPYRYLSNIGDVGNSTGGEPSSFPIDCDQVVQVSTKMVGTKTRIVSPFVIAKKKMTANFTIAYANASEYLAKMKTLLEAASKSFSDAEKAVKQILAEEQHYVQFDMSRLGHRESALLSKFLWVRRVKPLLQVRGMLQISNEAIYFQPYPNFSRKPVKSFKLAEVLYVFRRTYGIQANALEIINRHGKCMYLCFESQTECDDVAQILQEQRQVLSKRDGYSSGSNEGLPASLTNAEDILRDIHKITSLWQSGLLSNYHYLDFLNCAAGRSQNDFSQYPVFPWPLKDFTSDRLNLGEPSVYRDLTKPIGALNAKRLDYFKERMCGMSAEEQFLYGTHYSTPAYVIYWLLRAMPERMLRLHTGHFDALPRLFRSVHESWDSVNESTASLMELIPEFFVLPANWLENSLMITHTEGELKDVQLPRWASGVADFVCKMRAALESEYVSQNLPAWIDLIFGYKQSGEEAVLADNLFHPVCYMGATPDQTAANSLLPVAVLETQLQEFGRVPRQLFTEPHPPRLKIPQWDLGRLQRDSTQSEPWYKVVHQVSSRDIETATKVTTSPLDTQTDGTASQPRELNAGLLQTLRPQAVAPVVASGNLTAVDCCSENIYAIGEDGCLRVSPRAGLVSASTPAEDVSMRRNFRVSPMPLSALAVIRTDLLAIGGHDNAVTLYSSACGSAMAKCQVHADTVTCLGVNSCGTTLVSGSSDQSVRTWQVTPSSLRNDRTFDDIQQPVTCVASGRNLFIAGADDGMLLAWDARCSGTPLLERELGGAAVACAIHEDERFAAALDAGGELRIWDLRQGRENLRLTVAGGVGCDLTEASCFKTDFVGWVILGGTSLVGPAVALWDVPEQRALRTWAPPEALGDTGGPGVKFFVALSGFSGATRTGPSLLSASANGALHVFGRNIH